MGDYAAFFEDFSAAGIEAVAFSRHPDCQPFVWCGRNTGNEFATVGFRAGKGDTDSLFDTKAANRKRI
jgi:hypothetical protein